MLISVATLAMLNKTSLTYIFKKCQHKIISVTMINSKNSIESFIIQQNTINKQIKDKHDSFFIYNNK